MLTVNSSAFLYVCACVHAYTQTQLSESALVVQYDIFRGIIKMLLIPFPYSEKQLYICSQERGTSDSDFKVTAM